MVLEEKNRLFVKELGESIHRYFLGMKNGVYATPLVWLKAFVLLVLFFLLYTLTVWGDLIWPLRLMLVVLWGLVSLLIVFNIGHDAVHGAFSKYRWVNKVLGYSFNLVGANAYSWKLKHNDAHHQHTNIDGRDHDMVLDPFMRVSPHAGFRWHYRWQHLYWPFTYCLFSMLIILVGDFLIFFQVQDKRGTYRHPLREWIILVATKFIYLFYIFFIPVMYGGLAAGNVVIAFIVMHAVNGIVIGLVFQPSHYFLQTGFYNRDGKEALPDWHEHQLASTMDISPDNKVLSFLLGSLNANVAHHLYPRICHVHYPAISGMIAEAAGRNQIPYYRKSYPEAVSSHIALLKKLSRHTSC
jgi:linoleoyl-CoA desaturase